MRITNRLGLPEPIVEAVKNDPYTKGNAEFSATELIDPPQLRMLLREHGDSLEEDVSDRLWALYGQLGHSILERSGMLAKSVQIGDGGTMYVSYDLEKRFFATARKRIVSGQMDVINYPDTGRTISDWKFTSAFSAKYGLRDSWEKQLNIYAWLLRENGIAPQAAEIVTIYRDWTEWEARKNKSWYPPPVKRWNVPLWEAAEATKYVESRVDSHLGEIVPCTPDERWCKSLWRVENETGKGRKGGFKTRKEAEEYGNKLYDPVVVEYAGPSVRCKKWCPVASVCEQWKEEQGR
jgi:hypothetical protein